MRPRVPAAILRPQQKRCNSTFNARWLSEQKSRLGRLFFHGTTEEETLEAGKLVKTLTQNWRRYIAGAEGYLVCEQRRGLYRAPVNWGDMVCAPKDEEGEGREGKRASVG
jgi:hypothetical protein